MSILQKAKCADVGQKPNEDAPREMEKMENQATIEEVVKLELDYSKGFYLDIRNGQVHAGRNPTLATVVV